LESDVVANPQDHPRFQAVFVGQTPSVSALALLDVVVASCPMEDFSTTSSSATQPLHFKVCADRRKNRLVLAATRKKVFNELAAALRAHIQRGGTTP